MSFIYKIIKTHRFLSFNNLSTVRLGLRSCDQNPFGFRLLEPVIGSVAASSLLINPRTYCQKTNTEGGEEKKIVDASKDRSKVIPVEVSIRYLKSSAYETTYGKDPVWKHYRRNHKGQLPPPKTRKRCIRQNVISTGNPCPICRDEYLVLHPKNTELLSQFISPHTGAVLSYQLTGLCQQRHTELLVAIMQAKDMGLIAFDLPFQKYDYSEYVDIKQVE